MNKRIHIPQNHMPPTLPINSTGLYILLCDYFNAPEWVWTLVVLVLALMWIGCVHDLVNSSGRKIPGYGRKENE